MLKAIAATVPITIARLPFLIASLLLAQGLPLTGASKDAALFHVPKN